MNVELSKRIAALDGKQAIHYMTLITNGTSPVGGDDSAFLSVVVDDARRRAGTLGIVLPHHFEDAADALVEGPDVGAVARAFLNDLAQTPGGEEIVRAALDQPPTRAADFGLVTGALLLTFVWLAVTGDIDIKIGGVAYRKKGLSASDQVELGKKLLPAALKLLS